MKREALSGINHNRVLNYVDNLVVRELIMSRGPQLPAFVAMVCSSAPMLNNPSRV